MVFQLAGDETDRPRVLVLVAGDSDRRRLRERLGDDFEIAVAGADDDWGGFDACVVDDRTFPRAAEALAARRAAESPVFLPVLVLARTGEQAGELLSGPAADHVDDVAVVPTPSDLLRARVERLLETRRLSKRLDAERAQYRALAESADDAILVFDDEAVRFANPAVETAFERPPGEVEGLPVADLLDIPDTEEALDTADAPGRVLRARANGNDALVGRRADGSAFPVEVSVAPFEGDDGRLYTVVVRDVSERERRLAALAQERAVLAGIFDATPDVLVSIGPGGELRRWNDRLQELSGYDDAAIAEMAPEEFLSPADAETATEMVSEALERQEPVRFDADLLTADGETIPLEIAVATFDAPDGRAQGTVVAARDVRERLQRKRELERSRDLLDRTQRIASVGGWEFDLRSEEITWTDEAYRIHDLPVGEPMDVERALDFFHPEDRERLESAFRAAVEKDEEYDVECRLVTASDRVRWVHVQGVPGDSGDEAVLRGTIQDVTERKVQERELEELLGRVTDAFFALDEDWRFTHLNERAHELINPEERELVGEVIWEQFPKTRERAFKPAYERAMRDQETVSFEEYYPDPLDTWFQVTAYPSETGLSVYFRDVTDRKHRELELERFETIVQTAADPIYALDADGVITLANDALAELFGREPGDVVGRPIAGFLPDEAVERPEATIESLLRTGEDRGTFSLSLQDATGAERRYEVNVAVLRDDGEFAGTVGVARDVTDLVRHEQRLSVLDRVLRHNIRNKLNVVRGHGATLAGEEGSARVETSASAIVRACDDLLDLSESARRFESAIRPDETTRTSTDLAVLLDHLVKEVDAMYPDATVDLAVDADGPLSVTAHETLDLALHEVVENAIVHCDRPPEVAVTARALPEEDVVELRVVDNGPGLAQVELDALERGLETSLEHTSGLGLWFVRWAVESSGGSLSIEQNDPRGTVVVLRLPRGDG